MSLENEDFRTLMHRIVESQALLAEVVTRLANESSGRDSLHNLLKGVDENNQVIIAALHFMGRTH
jgi:capsular polysaccharide biosynthesis protein